MTDVQVDRLHKLLERSFGSDENPWISDSDVETAVFQLANRGVPLEQIKNIYMRRGRRNRMRGYAIGGFETLLWNMETTHAQMISIHGVIDATMSSYAVFTDLEITELVGVLRFPRKAGEHSVA